MQRPAVHRAFCLVAFGALAGWRASGQRAEDPQERETVEVDPKICDAYVGQYQMTPAMVLTLRRIGDRLTAQITGQPPLSRRAEGEGLRRPVFRIQRRA